MKSREFLLVFMLIAFVATSGLCADKIIEQHNIVLLIDASSHAKATWESGTRISHLRASLSRVLEEMNKNPSWGLNLGVRIMGDQSERNKNDCLDYRSAAKLDWFEPTLVNSIMEGIRPKGRNCLSNAIASAKEDFGAAREKNDHKYLLCIVSARDECTKDEKASMDWLIPEFNLEAIYFVGINVSKEDAAYFESICQDSKTRFTNTSSTEQLTQTLTEYMTLYCQGKPVPSPGEASSSPETNQASSGAVAGQ